MMVVYIPIGLCWNCSTGTSFVNLVETSFTDTPGADPENRSWGGQQDKEGRFRAHQHMWFASEGKIWGKWHKFGGGGVGVLPQRILKICLSNITFWAILEQNWGTLVTSVGHFAQIHGALWYQGGISAQFQGPFGPKFGALCQSWGATASLAPPLDQPLHPVVALRPPHRWRE